MLCAVEKHGLVEYGRALELQRRRTAERKAGDIPDTLILLQHPHVYTLGRNGRRENILASSRHLARAGITVFETDRGGDVTYHGPGQLVGYPVIDLNRHRRDVRWYMRSLEEVFIRTAAEYGIQAVRIEGCTGVWVGNAKLVAMGVHISRWVTSHGFAFNVSTDLTYFSSIIPCGLRDKGVTSLEVSLARPVAMEDAMERVIRNFGRIFEMEMDQLGGDKLRGAVIPAGVKI
ncbi:MAG: lipoyl(octanoyl) transferase LipB [Acidobacteriota bacterium]|nr:lipoyl(octanoyl) transferase LipB [Acidobacteriota bacterium]